MPMFHDGNRDLQDLFGSRALADRLEQRLRHSEFTDEDKAFIGEAAKLFPAGEVTLDTWKTWSEAVKAKTGRKGKQLFQPLRRVLTDQEHGPEMDRMLMLIGAEKARDRLIQAAP